jgi:hypothetical protein
MKIFVIDSISAVTHEMRGQIVVTGSHGGRSAAHLALAHPAAFVVFNDAGVGLDNAGIAGLEILQLKGVAACTVSHGSARIGEAPSTLATGVVSHANSLAHDGSVRAGQLCSDAISFFTKSIVDRG